jgi:hypothetical protein
MRSAGARTWKDTVVGAVAGLLVLGLALAAVVIVVVIFGRIQAGGWHLARTGDLGAASSVSCVSSTDCWAVGFGIEHLSGGAWTSVSSPSLGGDAAGSLSGVACPTADDCWAVGQNLTTEQVLVEHDAGGAWTLAREAEARVQLGELNAVTCVGPTDCWAVGDLERQSDPEFEPLIEHYSGTAWSVISSPAPQSGGSLSGVTCVGQDQCWAVGGWAGPPLVEHYSGGRWTVATTPALPSSGDLSAVACPDANECWAVGHTGAEYADGGPAEQPLVARDSGGGWSVVPTPRIDASTGAELLGVACQSSASCWAVGELPAEVSFGAVAVDGSVTPPAGALPPLIEHGVGAGWSVVDGPAIPGGSGWLDALTCLPAGDCWAVGGAWSAVGLRLVAESTS